MKDPIYCAPHSGMNRRERILHRIENVLCRLGLHDWDRWYYSQLWGCWSRMCDHCTKHEFTKEQSRIPGREPMGDGND